MNGSILVEKNMVRVSKYKHHTHTHTHTGLCETIKTMVHNAALTFFHSYILRT